MKVKIEYKFVLGDEYPFKAIARFDNDNSLWESSEVDYKTARELLLKKLKHICLRAKNPEPIPEPEDVEI